MKRITKIICPVFAALTLGWFALSPRAQAQLPSPTPDGGYPGDNTAEGTFALFNLDTSKAFDNTAIGFAALDLNTTGNSNTATGSWALRSNNGSNNTANGSYALFSNNGSNNTANGYQALYTNTTGTNNTATGVEALRSNNGSNNTANGYQALYTNTTGSNNTANGISALAFNTGGSQNIANGSYALYSNTVGLQNTATGFEALYSNTTGFANTANGVAALFHNTTGNENTATGASALGTTTGNHNTANGVATLLNNTTGDNNIALGFQAGLNLTTGNNNIDIGNGGVAAEANTVRIGTIGTQTNTFIAGISGVTVAKGLPVVIDANGHFGTKGSSERFKEAIKPMDKASEAILTLKPVTFRYKQELDPEGIPQFGLVAEQVEKVNPDLVARDADGKVYTVRYEAVNAMLLNEFLKEHRKNEEQEATIARQQKQIEALAAGLQKVSAQLELNKMAPQTIADNQ
jgi:hypothetical protein